MPPRSLLGLTLFVACALLISLIILRLHTRHCRAQQEFLQVGQKVSRLVDLISERATIEFFAPQFVRDTYNAWLGVPHPVLNQFTDAELYYNFFDWFLKALELSGAGAVLCYGEIRMMSGEKVTRSLPWLEFHYGSSDWAVYPTPHAIHYCRHDLFLRHVLVRSAQRVRYEEISVWLRQPGARIASTDLIFNHTLPSDPQNNI